MGNAIVLAAGAALIVYLALILPAGEINELFHAAIITGRRALLLAGICFVIVMVIFAPKFLEARRAWEASRYVYTCPQCGRSYEEGDPDGDSGVGGICNACIEEQGQEFFDHVKKAANPDTQATYTESQ